MNIEDSVVDRDSTFTTTEMNAIGLNFPGAHSANLDSYVVYTSRHLVFPNPLAVGRTFLGGEMNMPGVAFRTWLTYKAGDGWDGDRPHTFGHEAGLFLGHPGHSSEPTNLMRESTSGTEGPSESKRLSSSQEVQMHATFGEFSELKRAMESNLPDW